MWLIGIWKELFYHRFEIQPHIPKPKLVRFALAQTLFFKREVFNQSVKGNIKSEFVKTLQ